MGKYRDYEDHLQKVRDGHKRSNVRKYKAKRKEMLSKSKDEIKDEMSFL